MRSKLSQAARRAIQASVRKGETLASLAEAFGVSVSTVHRIVHGRASRASTKEKRKEYRALKRAERQRIRREFDSGEKCITDLANEYGVDTSTISRLVRGLTHMDD